MSILKLLFFCPLGMHEDICDTPIDENGDFAAPFQGYECKNCGDKRTTFKKNFRDK